jgi:hypothetical protein
MAIVGLVPERLRAPPESGNDRPRREQPGDGERNGRSVRQA